MLKVEMVADERARANVFAIRGAVFVAEQGVPIELEQDEEDLAAEHFLITEDGIPLGTGRLVVHGGEALLGRLAVLRQARGNGSGVALVRGIEERAGELGLTAVELHAQTHALRFYERLGYRAYGAQFDDAGIAHRHMRKELT